MQAQHAVSSAPAIQASAPHIAQWTKGTRLKMQAGTLQSIRTNRRDLPAIVYRIVDRCLLQAATVQGVDVLYVTVLRAEGEIAFLDTLNPNAPFCVEVNTMLRWFEEM